MRGAEANLQALIQSSVQSPNNSSNMTLPFSTYGSPPPQPSPLGTQTASTTAMSPMSNTKPTSNIGRTSASPPLTGNIFATTTTLNSQVGNNFPMTTMSNSQVGDIFATTSLSNTQVGNNFATTTTSLSLPDNTFPMTTISNSQVADILGTTSLSHSHVCDNFGTMPFTQSCNNFGTTSSGNTTGAPSFTELQTVSSGNMGSVPQGLELRGMGGLLPPLQTGNVHGNVQGSTSYSPTHAGNFHSTKTTASHPGHVPTSYPHPHDLNGHTPPNGHNHSPNGMIHNALPGGSPPRGNGPGTRRAAHRNLPNVAAFTSPSSCRDPHREEIEKARMRQIKAALRKERNKEAARRSNLNKKLFRDHLEQKSVELWEENIQLHQDIQNLSKKLNHFRHMRNVMQHVCHAQSGTMTMCH